MLSKNWLNERDPGGDMSAAAALLLSTAWLFGPLDFGVAELRLGGGFAQSTQVSRTNRLASQESYLEVGAAVAVSQRMWLEVTVPQHWSRQSYEGRIFFDRSDLGDIHLALGHRFGKDFHSGVAVDVPGASQGSDVGDRFAGFEHYFADIGHSSTQISMFGGYVHKHAVGRVAGRGRIALSTGDNDVTAGLDVYYFYEPKVTWFSFGPAVSAQWSPLGRQPTYLQIQLVERVGNARGWSFEFRGFTHVHAEQTSDSTGVTGTVVWRG